MPEEETPPEDPPVVQTDPYGDAVVTANMTRGREWAASLGGVAQSTRRNPDTGEWWVTVSRPGGGFEVWHWHQDSEADPVAVGPVVATHQEAHNLVEAMAAGEPPPLEGTDPPPPPTPQELAERLTWLKEDAKRRIDAAAERCRLIYVTSGTGQALEYIATENEGKAVMALPPEAEIPPGAYPMLEAELGILGNDVRAIAAIVVAEAAAWLQVGSLIKQIRRQSKAAVDAAVDEAGVQAVLAGIQWPGP